jgi:hypothetical protein
MWRPGFWGALVEALEPRVRWTEKLEEDLKKLKALGDNF